MVKIDNHRGDLSDVSAKRATLVQAMPGDRSSRITWRPYSVLLQWWFQTTRWSRKSCSTVSATWRHESQARRLCNATSFALNSSRPKTTMTTVRCPHQWSFFQNYCKCCIRYCYPDFYSNIMKINGFRAELTDLLAWAKSLLASNSLQTPGDGDLWTI